MLHSEEGIILANKITSIRADRIQEVANKCGPYRTAFGSELDQDEKIYEAGMREVLTDLAVVHFSVVMQHLDLVNPNHYDELNKKIARVTEDLQEGMSEAKIDLFTDYEETIADRSFMEEESRFVQGFIVGYMYLKKLHESIGK